MREQSHPDCAVCQKRLAYQRALRKRWIAARCCSVCGIPTRGKFKKCKKHRVDAMASHARQRARLKAA